MNHSNEESARERAPLDLQFRCINKGRAHISFTGVLGMLNIINSDDSLRRYLVIYILIYAPLDVLTVMILYFLLSLFRIFK